MDLISKTKKNRNKIMFKIKEKKLSMSIRMQEKRKKSMVKNKHRFYSLPYFLANLNNNNIK